MNEQPLASLLVRLLSLAFFMLLTFGAFFWFSVSSVNLISTLRTESQVIGFDKGAMYTLGCGLGLLAITVGGLMQGILKLKLTEKQHSFFSRSIVISLLLMVIYPQVAHYTVDSYLKSKQYSICDEVSYQWLIYSKLYYTKDNMACSNLIREKSIASNANKF
ncbi:hypothetical protein GCS56_002488 [Vibrio metschnikovii]|nr:hypothetical protein [Vibrio metschnikovii]